MRLKEKLPFLEANTRSDRLKTTFAQQFLKSISALQQANKARKN